MAAYSSQDEDECRRCESHSFIEPLGPAGGRRRARFHLMLYLKAN